MHLKKMTTAAALRGKWDNKINGQQSILHLSASATECISITAQRAKMHCMFCRTPVNILAVMSNCANLLMPEYRDRPHLNEVYESIVKLQCHYFHLLTN